MKFCSFAFQGLESYGVALPGDSVLDLRKGGEEFQQRSKGEEFPSSLWRAPDLKSWLAHGPAALEAASALAEEAEGSLAGSPAVVPQSRIRLRAPIPNPSKIVAVGLNYRDHAEEQNAPLPERPLIFAKFPSAVIGPGEEIRIPDISRQVDPEAELCAVVLERGRRFTPEQARGALAFMVGNDVSARDLQYSDKQWVRGKSCDTFAPCGPWLVTAEEVGDPHNLEIQLRVNGELRQSSNTRNLIFNCYDLAAFVSQAITLEVGDILFTGTPGGVGVYRNPPVFLQAGDVVEVRIDKLGVLKNPVVMEE